jgi:hypothetical protein
VASGGARGNAGRVADPNALRRERSGDSASWTLLAPFVGPAPEWPLSENLENGAREMTIWERLWRRPQASEWSRLGLEDEVALYARYLAEAELPDASSAVRTLVKQHQELLGLSTAGLNRLRWQLPAGDAPRVEAPTVKRKASSRARLKVVGNDG